MKTIIKKVVDKIKKVVDKIVEKPKKFYPVVDEHGDFEIVEKPKKFVPLSEKSYLLEQRRKGCYGNGQCKDF